MIFNLGIIFVFILSFFLWSNFFNLKKIKKFFKTNKYISFNKNNLNNWMNLTKKERYNQSKKESIAYLNKRKVLLAEIREEYKRISKEKNSEKT